eukprot:TRINITY_DN15426_c0_g1_i1.p1 TRINITY_DN15426_c0_g1~~TRINITY_DN15426_c0_g1_i1.p1  ORF type:complete len:162 (+),score=37.14 TRINITY_DN15426_c0_g1_i1:202-687(+)
MSKNHNQHSLTDIALSLLSHGADIEIRDNFGNTAAHTACYWGQHTLLALLLARGARVDVLNGEKQKPIDIASIVRGFEAESIKIGKPLCVALLKQWFDIRSLHGFCVFKCVVNQNADLSRLPLHLQREIAEIRDQQPHEWPMLIDRLALKRAGAHLTQTAQ